MPEIIYGSPVFINDGWFGPGLFEMRRGLFLFILVVGSRQRWRSPRIDADADQTEGRQRPECLECMAGRGRADVLERRIRNWCA